MNDDVKDYFRLNRIVLLVLGLWPYHQTSFTRFLCMLFSSITISFIVFQFTGLLSVKHNLTLVFKATSNMLYYMIPAVKYHTFWINMQSMKFLMGNIQCICKKLKNENEIVIIEKHRKNGERFAAVVIYTAIFIILLLLCIPFWPYLVNIILSINVTQSEITSYFVTEYFIDEKKSFYLATVHLYLAITLGALTIVAIGSFLVMNIEHGCGMFKIACYRMDQAMMVNSRRKNSLGNVMLTYKKLILAIEMHRNAIKFCEFIFSTMERPYFLLFLVLVICTSLQYYQILQIIVLGEDLSELLLPLSATITLLTYIFISNYIGQRIIDHNNCVYLRAYSIQWYKAPLSIQRMMLLILQNGSRVMPIKIGGLFSLSMECCASFMSTSLSYFTFVYTTQR